VIDHDDADDNEGFEGHDPATCEDCAQTRPVGDPVVFGCCQTPNDRLGITPLVHRGLPAVAVQTLCQHGPLPNAVAALVANEGWVRSTVILHPSVARRLAAELLNAADASEGTDDLGLEVPEDLADLNGPADDPEEPA
jgi:hypothetical protein